MNFRHHTLRMAHMLQHRFAFHARKNAIGEGKFFGVGGHVDAWHGKEIEVEIPGDASPGAADIEIPLAEREILRLSRIHHEQIGRREPTAEPPASVAAAVDLFQR
jgi:hypothetical protein